MPKSKAKARVHDAEEQGPPSWTVPSSHDTGSTAPKLSPKQQEQLFDIVVKDAVSDPQFVRSYTNVQRNADGHFVLWVDLPVELDGHRMSIEVYPHDDSEIGSAFVDVDNEYNLYIDGHLIGSGSQWDSTDAYNFQASCDVEGGVDDICPPPHATQHGGPVVDLEVNRLGRRRELDDGAENAHLMHSTRPALYHTHKTFHIRLFEYL